MWRLEREREREKEREREREREREGEYFNWTTRPRWDSAPARSHSWKGMVDGLLTYFLFVKNAFYNLCDRLFLGAQFGPSLLTAEDTSGARQPWEPGQIC